MVLDRIRSADMILNKEKCNWFKNKMTFLGYEISSDGVRPKLEKIEGIKNYSAPKNTKKIKSFLSVIGFYRNFISSSPIFFLNARNIACIHFLRKVVYMHLFYSLAIGNI